MVRFRFPSPWTGLLLFVLACTLTACAGDDDATPQTPLADEPAEPNDEIGEASSVPLDAPFTMSIQPAGDVDWFRVEVPGAGYLDVQAGQIPDDLDLQVAFARYEQWDAEKQNWIRDWHAPPVAIPVPEAGTYYLAVQDSYGDDASEDPIELRVRHLDAFDAHEPNDALEDATPAETGQPIALSIFPTGDQDWFVVDVPARRYLEAQARDVPEALGLEVSFSTYDEWSGEQTELRGWEAPPRALYLADSTRVYVGVQDNYGDARSEDSLHVRLLLLDDIDAFEPNDDAETAADLPRGDTLEIAIFPEGDRDYFRVSLAANDTLRVRAQNVPDLTLQAALFHYPSEMSDELEQVVDWTQLPAELSVEQAGTYYLVLQDDYSDESAHEAFQVIVQ